MTALTGTATWDRTGPDGQRRPAGAAGGGPDGPVIRRHRLGAELLARRQPPATTTRPAVVPLHRTRRSPTTGRTGNCGQMNGGAWSLP